jgi:hypothetical protein
MAQVIKKISNCFMILYNYHQNLTTLKCYFQILTLNDHILNF